jgi:hypothetical protein
MTGLRVRRATGDGDTAHPLQETIIALDQVRPPRAPLPDAY